MQSERKVLETDCSDWCAGINSGTRLKDGSEDASHVAESVCAHARVFTVENPRSPSQNTHVAEYTGTHL